MRCSAPGCPSDGFSSADYVQLPNKPTCSRAHSTLFDGGTTDRQRRECATLCDAQSEELQWIANGPGLPDANGAIDDAIEGQATADENEDGLGRTSTVVHQESEAGT